MATYVTSDIHGHYDLFSELLDKVRLKNLGYTGKKVSGNILYTKYLGDNEITIEIDFKNRMARKYVCNYRGKVEIGLNQEEMDIIAAVFLTMNNNSAESYHLIAEFYGARIFAKDKETTLIIDYNGGEEEMILHMDIATGEISENENTPGFADLKYIRHTLGEWHKTFKNKLLSDYNNGKFHDLPDYES